MKNEKGKHTQWEAINRGNLFGKPSPKHLIIDSDGKTILQMPNLSQRSYDIAASIVRDHNAAGDGGMMK